jgi:hypothetical protein
MVFGFLKGEFIDVISWTDDTRDTMVWRFERRDNAIKYGAMLTVREGQAAVFINEGQLADVFGPGLYELQTNNLPILTTLQSWEYGFSSPFKCEVYFINTTRFNNFKWGTQNPIMCRDPEFGPVRIRAYGTYSMRVTDPGIFMKEVVGTDGEFTADDDGVFAGETIGGVEVPALDEVHAEEFEVAGGGGHDAGGGAVFVFRDGAAGDFELVGIGAGAGDVGDHGDRLRAGEGG